MPFSRPFARLFPPLPSNAAAAGALGRLSVARWLRPLMWPRPLPFSPMQYPTPTQQQQELWAVGSRPRAVVAVAATLAVVLAIVVAVAVVILTIVVAVAVVVAVADASVAALVAVVFAVPLAAVGVAVPAAVDVAVGRGCGRSSFWGGSEGRGTGPLAAATT